MTLAEILDEVEKFHARFVVEGVHQRVADTLWDVHTYALDAFDVTPRLAVTSPGRRTGKTRKLEVHEVLVRNPVMTSSMSPSVLFRMVDQGPVTVLFDEVDAVFGRREGNEDLRALLNAGFARGGQVHRSEADGRKFVARAFNVFAPVALAAIGALPDTLSDRSIHTRMSRKTSEEQVERFRRRLVRTEAEQIRAMLEDWSTGAIEPLREAWPVIPDALDDRAADAWEPLLAIADMAGHGWDSRARLAAVALDKDRGADDETLGTLLLTHIRDAFDGQERLSTPELLGVLVDNENGPWGRWWGDAVEAGRTKGPASRLARELKAFGIVPTKWRLGEATYRGYEAADFADAWVRYLSPNGVSLSHLPETRHNATTPQETASDLHVPLWRSVGERATVASSGGNGICPNCGAASSASDYPGHANNCPRFYVKEER
jgi:hypothetical protein